MNRYTALVALLSRFDGRSQFYELLRGVDAGEPVFYAFDLLWLDGKDLLSIGRICPTSGSSQ